MNLMRQSCSLQSCSLREMSFHSSTIKIRNSSIFLTTLEFTYGIYKTLNNVIFNTHVMHSLHIHVYRSIGLFFKNQGGPLLLPPATPKWRPWLLLPPQEITVQFILSNVSFAFNQHFS